MKKIIFFVSILVFSLGISVFCFAAEKPSGTTVSSSDNTFSLNTIVNYSGRNGERLSTSITVNNMSDRYVPVVYFRYSPSNNDTYGLTVLVAIYDKQEKKSYVPQHSTSDSNFVNNNFYKTGQLVVKAYKGREVGAQGITFYIYRPDYLSGLNYQSNNGLLPYIIVNTTNSSTFPLFTPDEVNDKGQWFIEGNNYPYNKNNVWSDTIYYPIGNAWWRLTKPNPDPSDPDYNIYDISLQLVDNGNVKYKDLSKYYIEIWTSTEDKPDLLFQREYKLSETNYVTGVNYEGYDISDYYNMIFPYAIDFPNSTTNVYLRFRYVDNDVNLVSNYLYWTQKPRSEGMAQGTSWNIVKDNIPSSQKPSEVVPDTIKPGSLSGDYEFGDFNALDFVKGGGGLKSLTTGVSTVFSFLPPWLWQMMWYVLGALAVIALLKVVIS